MFQENNDNSVALNAFIIPPLFPILQLEMQLSCTYKLQSCPQTAPISVISHKMFLISINFFGTLIC